MTYVTYYSGSFNADQVAFVLAQLDRILKSASPMASESLNIQFLSGSLERVLVDSLPQKYRLTSPASENSNYHKGHSLPSLRSSPFFYRCCSRSPSNLARPDVRHDNTDLAD